jgi:starvation-inducible DNA-binding protein
MRSRLGLDREFCEDLKQRLAVLLADLNQLRFKALAFHWNVEDGRFASLHALFEEIYTQLNADMDELAERIRQLGFKAPGSLQDFQSLKRLSDTEDAADGDAMITQLAEDFERLVPNMRADISFADGGGDPGTADLITNFLRSYEKNIWILRAHLIPIDQ